ncbi:hypothetical protein CXB51_008128 [Gossypium anomalum]|uniref:Trichome birefringence-like N-terminal domain-containing protein n=1 Tax=Gossypium anomalum TaxID=47600 RepID=A0A8J6D6H0_9ROSI|nr:hypothetical protein CXB51_008128 [Gossypium anomalum]
MRVNWKSWSLNKDHLVKLAIGILLVGFACKLLVFRSKGFGADLEFPEVEKEYVQKPDLKPPGLGSQSLRSDLYQRELSLIEGHQNCMRNGRPDSEYLHWKWKPRDCQLPRFNAERFLELMRNKAWALIGDSISRNHVQSLLCMLATVEQPVEVYHDEQYKSKRWHFASYNFTVSNIWSPFLVKAAVFEDNDGVSTAEVQLHLDKLDKTWTDLYPSLDYMIISLGNGFSRLQSTMRMTPKTSTPDHFENGEWHNGGSCPKTTPAKEGEVEIKDLSRILSNVELEEFEKATAKAANNGVNLKLLDFTNLLLMRDQTDIQVHTGSFSRLQRTKQLWFKTTVYIGVYLDQWTFGMM